MFDFTYADFAKFVTSDRVFGFGRALLVLVLAAVAARLLRRAAGKLAAPRLQRQHVMMLQRSVNVVVYGLGLTWALREMGFEISVLLGAAGVFTVAIGFASQTSISNVISGLFLIFEEPFMVGDTIEVGVTGEILSIDLLSVKLRTGDNLYVRIPNETLLKSTVTNLTRFPIRSGDVQFTVDFAADIAKVREIAVRVATEQPLTLNDKAPSAAVLGYDEAGVRMQVTAWAERANLTEMKSTLYAALQIALREAGCALGAPRRHLLGANDIVPAKVP